MIQLFIVSHYVEYDPASPLRAGPLTGYGDSADHYYLGGYDYVNNKDEEFMDAGLQNVTPPHTVATDGTLGNHNLPKGRHAL
jgi:hypothetical protein